MKKLLTICAALFAVVAVNASAVDWSVASTVSSVMGVSPDGSDSTRGRTAYYTMLLFNSTDATAVTKALTGGSTIDFASLKSLALDSYQAGKAGSFSGTVSNLEGSSVTLFGIVFDTYSTSETIDKAGYYYQTGTITESTYDPIGSDPATKAVFTEAQMTGSWTAVPTGSSTGGDVPEPTSGLLVMLGMAGLALRRKQA